MRVAWIAALSLLVAPMAAEAACSTPYTTDGLLADLGAIDGFLAKGDDAAAGSGARQMASGLACLDSVLPLPIIGRVYRSLGGGLLVSGDTENGMRWLVTSAELEGTFEYGMEIPETSPIRSAWAEAQGLAGGRPRRRRRADPQGRS